MGTALVVILLAVCVIAAIRRVISIKKAGRSFSCGGDCSRCMGQCKGNDQTPKDKKY